MKIIIAILLVIILYCLGSALYFMVGRRGDAKKMAKALTWRIALSLALFLFLLVSYWFGWIQPHPLVINLKP